MTIDQKDIIDEIDKLHAEATKASDLLRMAGVNPPSDIFALIRTVSTFNSEIHVNWPAIRDRLREAERKASDVNDELKSVLADWNEVRSASGSKTNLNAKHRKPQNSMSKPIAEAFDDMVAILRGDADEATKRSAFDTLEEIVFPSVLGDVVFEPQPDQPDTGFGTHVVPEYKPSAQPEPSGDSIAKRVDALERLTQELASAHCATFPPDQRIVGLVKRLADPVLRCCLQLNNEYKARDFVGTHAERSLLCNAIDECQAIIAELSAAEARLFSMRLPFHPEAKRDA